VKDIIVIGGPNGAGKTTAAWELLIELGVREFVNADEIARGLSPFDEAGVAVAAGRVMIARMRDLVRAERSFAFETTCAGLGHADFSAPVPRRLARDAALSLAADGRGGN
jgi:predicted ABC-type ATPase